MLKWQDWDINYWPGGWVRATDKTGVTVVLHYKAHGEGENLRLRLHTTLMTSVEPITARRWRDVPLGEIEEFFKLWMWVGLPGSEEFQRFLTPSSSGPPSADDALSWFEENESQRLKIGANVPTSKLIDDEIDPHTPWETVKRPEGGRLTDDFLENLAAVYKYLVARGEDAPARMIGQGADVPVPTVHRWVARARARGFLPPAVKGRAG
jgi:hypothetical protein